MTHGFLQAPSPWPGRPPRADAEQDFPPPRSGISTLRPHGRISPRGPGARPGDYGALPPDVYIPAAAAAVRGRYGGGGGGRGEPQGPRAALPLLHQAHPLQPAGAESPCPARPPAAAGRPPEPRRAGGDRDAQGRSLRLLLLLRRPRRARRARGAGRWAG